MITRGCFNAYLQGCCTWTDQMKTARSLSALNWWTQYMRYWPFWRQPLPGTNRCFNRFTRSLRIMEFISSTLSIKKKAIKTITEMNDAMANSSKDFIYQSMWKLMVSRPIIKMLYWRWTFRRAKKRSQKKYRVKFLIMILYQN